jgi:sugar lactone lactonase YvrE
MGSADNSSSRGWLGRRAPAPPPPLALAALAVGVLVLSGCGGSGSREVTVRALRTGARECPGGAVTAAGRRALGSGASGCPYTSAATIGRPGEGVFRQPEALAVSPSGRVYVADQFSHLVQTFSPTGAFVGQWGSAGARPGEFGAVGGLAIDAHGNVYLVDATNDRVEKYTATGRFITSWGARGTAVGQFDFGAGDGPDKPPGGGIAVGGSYVYVSDTRNNRIERFALDGSGARVLVGKGSAPGQVRRPQGLALAGAEAGAPEALYVADNGNDRVQELIPDGRFVAEASVFDAKPGSFQNPYDVAVHGGFVYVVDDNHGRIVRFDRGLRYLSSFSGAGAYRLTNFLRAAAAGPSGAVYVADSSADRIEMFSLDGAAQRAWGSSGIAPGQFVAPVDVAAGPAGRVLVAEGFREIVPLFPAGTPYSYRAQVAYDSPWSSGGGVTLGARFFSPTGLAFAPDGTVWVSDRNNDVLRHLSGSGHFLAAVGGPAASRGGAPTMLSEPHGVSVATSGDVYVADTGASRVLTLSPDGRVLAQWSSPRTAAAGAHTRGFTRPLDVASGAGGTVYVADTGEDEVRAVDPAGRVIASWGGTGTAPGHFESPDGLAVDAARNVFVADGVLDRVQEFTARGKLLAVFGRQGTALGELNEPTGMSVDCHGDLLVADTGNNRVQLFAGAAPAASCGR